MPGFDGTGPAGMGPMTGGGRGFCAIPLTGQPVLGAGWGRGGFGQGMGRGWFGRGRGWRHWYWATGVPGWARAGMGLPARGGWTAYPYYGTPYGYPYGSQMGPQQEADMLKEQAKMMQDEIKTINDRISELEKVAHAEEKK